VADADRDCVSLVIVVLCACTLRPAFAAESYPVKPEFAACLRQDVIRWAKVVKDSGAHAD
jgi:hypothetical protein